MSKKKIVIVGVIVANLIFFAVFFSARRPRSGIAESNARLIGDNARPVGPNSELSNPSPPTDEAGEVAGSEAAHRSESRRHLMQIALALHNFLAANNSFPAGTHPHPDLDPEKRLSWICDVLPFLDQNSVFKSIDFKKAWNDPVHERLTKLRLDMLLTPGAPDADTQAVGVTNYVGIAGVGVDAPLLPVTDPRAGTFGYNRTTTLADIKDGTSNTIMVTEAKQNLGPWIAGGRTTIRSLTSKPYINGPDGIGGPYKGGMNVAIGDGSVRFISENIDPKVLEALTTINGGEPIPQF